MDFSIVVIYLTVKFKSNNFMLNDNNYKLCQELMLRKDSHLSIVVLLILPTKFTSLIQIDT